MTQTATEIADQVAADLRETIRENISKMLGWCPQVTIIGEPEWDWDGPQYDPGVQHIEAITGCRAEAQISIIWDRTLWTNAVMEEAIAAFDEQDLLNRWCMNTILRHTAPPGEAFGIEQAHELAWTLERTGQSYDAANERLTFAVQVTGEN